MSDPRQHHYLPRFYLEGFCAEAHRLNRKADRVYVYERGRDPRPSTPKNEARIRDLYSFEGTDGKRNVEWELLLSKHEDAIAPILRAIREREAARTRRLLNNRELRALAEFVGVTFMRGPAGLALQQDHIEPACRRALEEAAQSRTEFRELVLKLYEGHPISASKLELEIEDSRQKILAGWFQEPKPPEMRLASMVNTGIMIADVIVTMRCQLVIAPKHESFITGDLPVVTMSPSGSGARLGTSFATPATEVWFPIGSKLALRWGRTLTADFGKLPPRGVRMMNRNVMRFSARYVYSRSDSQRLRDAFDRTKQEVFLGKTAFIPMRDGRAILE